VSLVSIFFCPFEVITLEGSPQLSLCLISFPFEENIIKISLKLRATIPNNFNDWAHNTIGILRGAVNQYQHFLPLSIIIYKFHFINNI
jgi:hypothetical protein